jgi:pimeloyl-ACP methyl ester carboxylesterase
VGEIRIDIESAFVSEEPFEVSAGTGVLCGHRGGEGPPALLLHGGPAVPDYTEGCAAELRALFHTIRYTQHGAPPSTAAPPFSIEAHLADACAVLDALGIERAYAVGHSWGGHLSLHLLARRPERLLGVICVDPLGAFDDVFADVAEHNRRVLPPIAECGHFPWAERPGELRRAVEQNLDFLGLDQPVE